MKKRLLASLFGIILSCALPCSAQFIGYTSSQSTAQSVFTNQSANAVSGTLSNIGQSSHFLTVCNSALNATVSLEASIDGTFASPITIGSANYGQTGLADSSCHTIQAGGYYPAVRARVKNYLTGSTTVFYTGIGGPIAPAPAGISTIGPSAPVVCDLPLLPGTISTGLATTSIATGFAGETIVVCGMTLSFSAAPTTGQIQFTGGTGVSCSSATFFWTLNVTATTPQTVFLGGGLAGGLFRLVPGQTLCIATTTITSSFILNATYAQISF